MGRAAKEPGGIGAWGLSIDFPAVSDFEDHDGFFGVINGIENPPIALADAVALPTLHFFAAMGPGLTLEVFNFFHDAGHITGREGAEFFFRASFQENLIGGRHASGLSGRIPNSGRAL